MAPAAQACWQMQTVWWLAGHLADLIHSVERGAVTRESGGSELFRKGERRIRRR